MPNILRQAIFTAKFGRYQFSPGWLPSIAFIIFLPFLLSLGVWQLHRADDKRALAQDFKQRALAKPLNLAAIKPEQDIRYYNIKLSGAYENQYNFLLDNKMNQGQVGYLVITAFKTTSGQVVLINRGWIARGVSLQKLPTIAPAVGAQTLSGLIDVPSQHAFVLGNNVSNDAWPKIIQAVNFQQISEILKQPVLPIVVLLSPEAAQGFVREWRPVEVSPYKHIGYAIQWFSLALLLVILFFVLNLSRVSHGKEKRS